MMEKILLGSSYLAQAIVMATIAFAVISTIYYLRYNKKIICQPGWIIKYIFLVYIATVGMVTRVLDITSWSYGGFTAWNIVPFVNESWKLMLLNTLMFLPMGLFVPIFIKKINSSRVLEKIIKFMSQVIMTAGQERGIIKYEKEF